MTSFLGVRWDEWFILAMMVFTLGAPVFFLIYFWRRHYMDNPDCSKYDMLRTDPDLRADERVDLPSSCEPSYLQSRPWWNSVNTTWVWVSLGIAFVWFLIMIIGFVASRGIPELRQAFPG